jgi:hypothetical protein
MSFPSRSARNHHIPKQRFKVRNWSSYNESLRRRGSLTVWFSDDAVAGWNAEKRTTKGGQPLYSDLAILAALTLRSLFHQGLRQTEGLVGSIVRLLGVDLAVPDFSTLSRRSGKIDVRLPCSRQPDAPLEMQVDSTGVRFHGAGEWTTEKHGTKTRKSWRKLHLAIDAETGDIVAVELTDKETDDGAMAGPLLDQVSEPVASFTADGAYDTEGVTAAIEDRHPQAQIIVPPRVTATLSKTAETTPTQRDKHLFTIQKHGRRGWRKRSGYNRRSRVETMVGRYKKILGEQLHSKIFQNQKIEARIGAYILNQMTKLGRADSVRIA